jgi:sucrose synthase
MTPYCPHDVILPEGPDRRLLHAFFKRIREAGKIFLLQSDIADLLSATEATADHRLPSDSKLRKILETTMSAAFHDPWLTVETRPSIGRWCAGRFHVDQLSYEGISASDFMRFRENLVNGHDAHPELQVEYDGTAFLHDIPLMKDRKHIGRGVEYLNRTLSSRLFADPEKRVRTLVDFLRVHQHKGRQLMLTDRIDEPSSLREAINRAEDLLANIPGDTPWDGIRNEMNAIGLEVGWGDTAGRVRETLGLLAEVIDAPDPNNIESFLSRVPMIFSVVIFSPHGFFGQSKVLGLPDTGGQVVYILDQVRALEKEMRQRLRAQGLSTEPRILVMTRLIPEAGDTDCDLAEETIQGTRNARILRVPFTRENGEIVPEWISRFRIWPYLERFARDSEKTFLAELGERPDLIIGNYSDGNLVATLLARRLGVTQCNIAHALEKTKYLFSDLYWKENDAEYHFSAHFTADLLAMNSADFIITSTYQEIAGNATSVGQYESYSAFTMPGLYRVIKGIDVFDPKFNIVSPGADEEVYFPFTDQQNRIGDFKDDIDRLLTGDFPGAVSHFADPAKPVIFLMSRLDRVKNVTGFVEWYGENRRLQELANVFIIAGNTRIEDSNDDEERREIEKLHGLIRHFNLQGHLRWVPKQSDKVFNGELYRVLAERRGVFVQPATFEAFGLTVIEAMTSGLPTFATIYGGPLEIIEDGKSGFHIDPNHGAAATATLVDFFERCAADCDYWLTISRGGIERVEARYTWKRYSERLMTLSRVYGFWKYVSHLERSGSRAYDRLFYASVYRPIIEKMNE